LHQHHLRNLRNLRILSTGGRLEKAALDLCRILKVGANHKGARGGNFAARNLYCILILDPLRQNHKRTAQQIQPVPFKKEPTMTVRVGKPAPDV
jgi:hypothetical protein